MFSPTPSIESDQLFWIGLTVPAFVLSKPTTDENQQNNSVKFMSNKQISAQVQHRTLNPLISRLTRYLSTHF